MNDTDVVDSIHTLLAGNKRWHVEDLETVADLIGEVRAHPGKPAV